MWWKKESAYPTLWKSQIKNKGGYADEERIPQAIITVVQLMEASHGSGD
jgi:predicted transcriptional regulator